jgi:hypothetical protein
MKPLLLCLIINPNATREPAYTTRVSFHDSLVVVPRNEFAFPTMAKVVTVEVGPANVTVGILRVDGLRVRGVAAVACGWLIERKARLHDEGLSSYQISAL